MRSIQRICVIVAVLSLVLSGTAFANESADMAVVIPGSAAVQWAPAVAYESMSLRVAGPDDSFEFVFGPSELPVFSVFDEFGNVYPDGKYNWEYRLTPVLPDGVKRAMDEARRNGTDEAAARQLKRSGLLPDQDLLIQSGSFTIAGGSIVDGSLPEETRRGAPISVDAPARSGDGPTPMSAADQVFIDDVIVDGSLCAGQDCVNGENFGFDTIRMKENNLRLHFDDTSNSASFPNNDWRLVANDSSNGGANKFVIEDATAGRNPFTIEAGANANTLYVEADGDVGVKTANPVVDIHIVEGNTPTLRLEQDGSDGFTPQTYDIAANEANFFIRDVTNGSRLFFRSKPGAPEDSIFIAANGDIGLGTDGPSEDLHVRGTDGGTQLLVEEASATAATRDLMTLVNNGRVEFRLEDTSTAGDSWTVANTDIQTESFVITAAGSGENEMILQSGTNGVTFSGPVRANNGADTLPDFVFEPDYQLMPLNDLKSFIEREKHLPRIPSVADVKAAGGVVDMSEMQYRLLEKVEELTLYTLQQEETIRALQARLDAMEGNQ